MRPRCAQVTPISYANHNFSTALFTGLLDAAFPARYDCLAFDRGSFTGQSRALDLD